MRVFHGVGGDDHPAEGMPTENHFLDPHRLPPLFEAFHQQAFLRSVQIAVVCTNQHTNDSTEYSIEYSTVSCEKGGLKGRPRHRQLTTEDLFRPWLFVSFASSFCFLHVAMNQFIPSERAFPLGGGGEGAFIPPSILPSTTTVLLTFNVHFPL